MTRLEYLTKLEENLSSCSMTKQEINEITRDLAGFFNEKERLGKRETEIVQMLGKPDEVADLLIAQFYCRQLEATPSFKNLFKAQGALKKLSITAFLFGIPVVFLLAFLLFLIILGVFSVFAVAVSGIGVSIYFFRTIPLFLSIFIISASIFFVGVGLTLSKATAFLVESVAKAIGACYLKICQRQSSYLQIGIKAGGLDV